MTWDEAAATWDTDEVTRAYAAAAFASLERLLATEATSLDGARVLDFGCGTGLLTEQLASRCSAIDAVDASQSMLAVLAAKIEREGWQHVRALAEVPAESAPYNLVVCSSVCAFLDDYPAEVSRLAEGLRPGGLFMQWDWELDPADDEPFGMTRDGIRSGLTGAGLEVIQVETAFSVPIGEHTMRPLLGVGRKPLSG